MELDIQKDRLHLRFRYNPDLVAAVKAVSGARWAKTYNAWTFPATLASFRSLRALLPAPTRNHMTPEVREWARTEIARERALRTLAREHDAVLRVVPSMFPATAEAMAQRVYQRAGARFVAESGGRCLIADEPGLGKTVQVFAGLAELGAIEGTHLVFATKSASTSVWKRQARMWAPGSQVVALPDGAEKRRAAIKHFLELDEPRFLVSGYAAVRRLYGQWCAKCEVWEEDFKHQHDIPEDHWFEGHSFKRSVKKDGLPELMAIPWDAVVLDESHKALASYTPSNVSQQTQALLDLKRKYPIALTGTPLRGAEQRIWGTLDWLGYKTGGYWGWINEYFDTYDSGFGKRIDGLNPDREEAFHRMLDGLVLRRTRVEVRPELPPGQRHEILVPLEGKHKQQYEAFALEAEVALATGTIESQGLLSELTRLRQMAYGVWDNPSRSGVLVPTLDSPKLNWVVDFLAERGVAGAKESWRPEAGSAYKYVIASEWTQVLNSMESELNRLGIETYKIVGETKKWRRDVCQERFQSDKDDVRVMLLNTFTGGESIELDSWCDEMVILDQTYVADDQVQLEGRINNRSGRIAPRSWYYLVTEGTIEESIADTNKRQHNLQHLLLDKRRGVETALHLIGGR